MRLPHPLKSRSICAAAAWFPNTYCATDARHRVKSFPLLHHQRSTSLQKYQNGSDEGTVRKTVFVCLFFCFFCSSHSLSSLIFFSLSFQLVTQIRGHIAGSSTPFPLRCVPSFQPERNISQGQRQVSTKQKLINVFESRLKREANIQKQVNSETHSKTHNKPSVGSCCTVFKQYNLNTVGRKGRARTCTFIFSIVSLRHLPPHFLKYTHLFWGDVQLLVPQDIAIHSLCLFIIRAACLCILVCVF